MELEAEDRELRRANAILKTASALLRGGARPRFATLLRFVDEHRHDPVLRWGGRVFGVEPICKGLTERGQDPRALTTRPRGDRGCARAIRDEQLVVQVWRVHVENYRGSIGPQGRCDSSTEKASRWRSGPWNR
jgi:hypothetical protein